MTLPVFCPNIKRIRRYNIYWQELVKLAKDKQIDAIFTLKDWCSISTHLLWTVDSIKSHIIIDSDEKYYLEQHNAKLISRLWDSVIVRDKYTGFDPIKQTGWISAMTGQYFTKREMQEYADNVLFKIKHLLTENSTVLEIGCASGITTFAVAPKVKNYIATDLSEKTLEKTIKEANHRGFSNIKFYEADALDVANLCIQNVDIVIVNSVAQYFPGYNYFFHLIDILITSLKSKGFIYLGDLIDYDKRDDFVSELRSLGRETFASNGDLCYRRYFIKHLCDYFPEILDICISNKKGSINNELVKYRFDVIISIDKNLRRHVVKPIKYYGCSSDFYKWKEVLYSGKQD